MQHYARLLSEIAPVVTFDYSYMEGGKKRPDPLPQLIQRHADALCEGRKKYGTPPILIGKSMGGRVGCHVALAREHDVPLVICLGYPLLAMGRPDKMRDVVLLQLKQPVLFVQGTRDKLCPLPLLKKVLDKRSGKSVLHVAQSGDHSLMPTRSHLKEHGLSQEDFERDIFAAIQSFVTTELG